MIPTLHRFSDNCPFDCAFDCAFTLCTLPFGPLSLSDTEASMRLVARDGALSCGMPHVALDALHDTRHENSHTDTDVAAATPTPLHRPHVCVAANWRPMWMGMYLHTPHTRASCAKHHHAFVLATPHYNCTLHPYARRQAPSPPALATPPHAVPNTPAWYCRQPSPTASVIAAPPPPPHAATSTVPNPAPDPPLPTTRQRSAHNSQAVSDPSRSGGLPSAPSPTH